MKTRKRIILVSAFLIWTVLIAAVSFQAGKRWKLYHAGDMETFYATIVEKRGNDLLVEGMEENDINFREGLFLLDLEAGTEVTWRGTEISVGDLNGGDRISVTFSGSIAESYPARIMGSVYIKLLDDKM